MKSGEISRIEHELTRIWSEALETDVIGVNDGFAALGGESLTAARALLQIRERFQVEVSLSQFYAARTVRNLSLLIASLLEQRRGASGAHGADSQEGFL